MQGKALLRIIPHTAPRPPSAPPPNLSAPPPPNNPLQVRLLLGMLSSSPWHHMPLTLQFLAEEHAVLPRGEAQSLWFVAETVAHCTDGLYKLML